MLYYGATLPSYTKPSATDTINTGSLKVCYRVVVTLVAGYCSIVMLRLLNQVIYGLVSDHWCASK